MRGASLALVGALASSLAPSTIPPVAKRISAAHVDKYRRDGVVVIRGVADIVGARVATREAARCEQHVVSGVRVGHEWARLDANKQFEGASSCKAAARTCMTAL